MQFILVVERKHLFSGLSPQGYLASDAVDLARLAPHLFFAERAFMEANSHYKQVVPYLILYRGRQDDARVLAYQRRQKHTETRLGGLWSVGFGGHIEPDDQGVAEAGGGSGGNPDGQGDDLIDTAALRELAEETGLVLSSEQIRRVGFINSDRDDVSSVHFGVVYRVNLDGLAGSDDEILTMVAGQAEPHRALWLPVNRLRTQLAPDAAPDGGSFENWSCVAVEGMF